MNSFKYCQSQIEGNGKCKKQCEHCKEYFKPLEDMKKTDSLFKQLHEANEKIKQLEKKYKCCATCFCFNDFKNYSCDFHGDKAMITSPKTQLCEQYK
jgi:hypothetical protein